jgi:hypothetical protein
LCTGAGVPAKASPWVLSQHEAPQEPSFAGGPDVHVPASDLSE